MIHLESLAITDSQALKKAEIEGFAKWWKQASYIIHAAIYLDVLSPIKHLPKCLTYTGNFDYYNCPV